MILLFTGLVNKDANDAKGKNVALFVGDTVLVGDEAGTLLTPSKRKSRTLPSFSKTKNPKAKMKEKKTLYPIRLSLVVANVEPSCWIN